MSRQSRARKIERRSVIAVATVATSSGDVKQAKLGHLGVSESAFARQPGPCWSGVPAAAHVQGKQADDSKQQPIMLSSVRSRTLLAGM
jgi:hypothetical protein